MMRIKPMVYGGLVLVVFFGIILGFQAAGFWSISGKVSTSGDQIQPSAGDVNSIKGWMTLEQITTTFGVPLADLLDQFNLPADTPANTAIKDLESDLFSVTNLRAWLENRTQPQPSATTISSTEEVNQPITPTQMETATEIPTPMVTITLSTAMPTPAEHITLEKTITGKTTFQELLDWGVPEEVIKKVLSGNMPPASAVIKDYVTGKGMAFSTIKTQLQVEVDKTK
jgi:hypothetical protein